jgi:hypothetical protein
MHISKHQLKKIINEEYNKLLEVQGEEKKSVIIPKKTEKPKKKEPVVINAPGSPGYIPPHRRVRQTREQEIQQKLDKEQAAKRVTHGKELKKQCKAGNSDACKTWKANYRQYQSNIEPSQYQDQKEKEKEEYKRKKAAQVAARKKVKKYVDKKTGKWISSK